MPLRVLIHALFFYLGAHVLRGLSGYAPRLGNALDAIGYAGFIPFSVASAIGLHDTKYLLLGLVAALFLTAECTNAHDLARVLLPIGAGLIVGQGVRRAMKEQVTAEVPHA